MCTSESVCGACACVRACIMCAVGVSMYIYVSFRVYTCCACMLVYTYMCTSMCTYVFVYQNVYLVACHSDTDPLARSELDPYSCSPWSRYIGDSKTDPWDDSEIHIGSCSEDQTAIQTQNRVISCECLLFSYFLIYRRQ